MKTKSAIFLSILIIIFVSLLSCKNEDEKILDKSHKLSEESASNQKLKQLRESMRFAKDDYERSEIYKKIASIEFDKGDISSSVKNSIESIKYYPNMAKAHYLLGKSYLANERYDEAESELNIAIDLDERYAPAHFEKGNYYYKKRMLSLAVIEYEKAVKYDTNHYEAYNNLGVVYYSLYQITNAEQAFKKASEIMPDFPSAYKNLGIIYDLKLGNKKHALKNYKKYLKYCPNAPEREAVKLWISSIEKKGVSQ